MPYILLLLNGKRIIVVNINCVGNKFLKNKW